MSYATIFYVLGWLIMTLAGTMTLPILAAFAQGDGDSAFFFATSAALTLFFGGGLVISLRGSAIREPGKRENLLLAVLFWILIPAFAALPFYQSSAIPSITDAYFEAVSGFTTTGMSILNTPEDLPRSILLWRALLQWLGGISAIVMGLTVLAVFGIGGLQLYRGTLPRGEADTLFRRLRYNFKALIGVYSTLTLIAILTLWATGTNLFTAVTLAFSAVSTSGFVSHSSTHSEIVSGLGTCVLAVLLIIAALPAPVLIETFKGRWKQIRSLPELRHFWFVLLLAILVFAGYGILHSKQLHFAQIGRDILQAISYLTTSGLELGNSSAVVTHPMPIYLTVMIIGGCALSTAGGIKIMRLVLLMMQGNNELYRLSFPKGIAKFLYGGQRVEQSTIWSVWTFFAIFTLSLAAFVALLGINGLSFPQALSLGVSALTTTGTPHLPDVLPYSDISHGAKWVATAGMIVGRLEVLAFFVVIYRSFWRN